MKKILLLILISFYSFGQTGGVWDGIQTTSRNNLTTVGLSLGIVGTTTGPYGMKGIVGLIANTNTGTNITLTGISPVSVSGSNNNYSISSTAISTLTGTNALITAITNGFNVSIPGIYQTTITGSGTASVTPITNGFNISVPGLIAGSNITIAGNTISGNTPAINTVGQIFSENWANLTNWTTVASPGAVVSSNALNFTGTSGIANYIRCSGYGLFNYERATFTDRLTVGGINATSSGIGIGIQGQVSTSPAAFTVNIELSNSSTGTIKWYYNGVLFSTSGQNLSVIAGDILIRNLKLEKNRYVFSVKNTRTGYEVSDVSQLDLGKVTTFNLPYSNAGNFAYYFLGGATHKVSDFIVSSNHKTNVDILIPGDSRERGSNAQDINSRNIDYLNNNYIGTFEVLAQSGNRAQDFKMTEIALINAVKVQLSIGVNNILNESAATAWNNYQALITALGVTTCLSAPNGYSVANGNLVLGLIEPTNAGSVIPFNTSILGLYNTTASIDFYSPAWSGTGSTINSNYSLDGTHYNAIYRELKADVTAKYHGLKTRVNNEYGSNYITRNRFGYTGIGQWDFDPLFPLHILSSSTGGSQIVFGSDLTNFAYGSSLTSTQNTQVYLFGGAVFNGTNFIPGGSSASAINLANGTINFQCYTGLTPGVAIGVSSFAVMGITNTNGFTLGNSSYTGAAKLHLVETGNISQMIFSNSSTKNGGALTSLSADHAEITGGAFITGTGTAFVASSTSASGISLIGGSILFKEDIGLTGAVAFIPTVKGRWSPTGFYIGGNTVSSSTLYVGGSLALQSLTVTANSTFGSGVHTIFVNTTTSTIQILPAIAGITDREYLIMNITTTTSTISATGAALIGGAGGSSSIVLSGKNKSIKVKSDGANWQIIQAINYDAPITSAHNDLTSQTGAVTTVTSFVATNTTSFEIGGYVTITAVVTDVLNLQVNWTDQNNTARSQTFSVMGTTTPSLSATGFYGFSPYMIRALAGTSIVVSTVLTTGIGSIAYDVGSVIKQLY